MVLSEVWETICAIYVYHILQCIVNKKKIEHFFCFQQPICRSLLSLNWSSVYLFKVMYTVQSLHIVLLVKIQECARLWQLIDIRKEQHKVHTPL